MTATGPPSRPPGTPIEGGAPDTVPPPPAESRSARFTYANMLRSLVPLVVICLLLVAWVSWRQNPEDPVREVDPSSTVQLAAARADYPLVVPTDLADGYRPTDADTDAGTAQEGDPVTLEISYVTPSVGYVAFVISDDPDSDAVRAVLDDAEEQGTRDLGGATWTRSTTARGETALSREEDGVTVVVSGSAGEEELEAVAASVRPFTG